VREMGLYRPTAPADQLLIVLACWRSCVEEGRVAIERCLRMAEDATAALTGYPEALRLRREIAAYRRGEVGETVIHGALRLAVRALAERDGRLSEVDGLGERRKRV